MNGSNVVTGVAVGDGVSVGVGLGVSTVSVAVGVGVSTVLVTVGEGVSTVLVTVGLGVSTVSVGDGISVAVADGTVVEVGAVVADGTITTSMVAAGVSEGGRVAVSAAVGGASVGVKVSVGEGVAEAESVSVAVGITRVGTIGPRRVGWTVTGGVVQPAKISARQMSQKRKTHSPECCITFAYCNGRVVFGRIKKRAEKRTKAFLSCYFLIPFSPREAVSASRLVR
jgi:hypothetical protein